MQSSGSYLVSAITSSLQIFGELFSSVAEFIFTFFFVESVPERQNDNPGRENEEFSCREFDTTAAVLFDTHVCFPAEDFYVRLWRKRSQWNLFLKHTGDLGYSRQFPWSSRSCLLECMCVETEFSLNHGSDVLVKKTSFLWLVKQFGSQALRVFFHQRLSSDHVLTLWQKERACYRFPVSSSCTLKARSCWKTASTWSRTRATSTSMIFTFFHSRPPQKSQHRFSAFFSTTCCHRGVWETCEEKEEQF